MVLLVRNGLLALTLTWLTGVHHIYAFTELNLLDYHMSQDLHLQLITTLFLELKIRGMKPKIYFSKLINTTKSRLI